MNPGHIDAVFVAGKVRKWRGKLVGVDMARVMRLVTESRDSLWRRAGYAVDFMA
jgi:5-methylthioadenosine/S-adenosylhomocysteine deaminase